MDHMKIFHNRQDAGKQLAQLLTSYKNNPKTIVLGLPRGGVPVAYEIAKALQTPLDIFIARKLGAPYHEELAFGAIAGSGVLYLNDNIISQLHLSENQIQSVLQKEQLELIRREQKYRGNKEPLNVSGKIVILVDDGIATGASMHAAIAALKKLSPQQLILAVPVAPESIASEMKSYVDEFICVYPAPVFYSVGQFYEDFSQTTDEEVQYFLR